MVIRLLDLFSGIGGFSYAAEKLVGGYETVAFCEQDEFAKSSTPTTEHRATQCRMGYMADGISEALFGHFSEEPADIPRVATNQKDRTKKLKALGNSIVPQVVAELFYAIRIAEYGE